MTNTTNESKARFILAIDSIVSETLENADSGWTASPEFILSLCESVMAYVSDCLQPDLLAFAHHAKRKKVTIDDVLLASRRSPAIAYKLRQLIDEAGLKKTEAQAKRRSTTTVNDDEHPKGKVKQKKIKLAFGFGNDDENEGATQSELDEFNSDAENYYEEDIFAD